MQPNASTSASSTTSSPPPSREPTREPSQPPAPKVKMSLKDFALLKKKRREEMEKEREREYDWSQPITQSHIVHAPPESFPSEMDHQEHPFQQKPLVSEDAQRPIDWFDDSLKRSSHYIAKKTCETICYLWFSSPFLTSHQTRSPPYSSEFPAVTSALQLSASPTFVSFMQKLLETTQVSQSVIVLSLHYIWRLKELNRSAVGSPGSEFRIAVTALMVANKFFDGQMCTNKAWSEASGIELAEISRMEREFLMGFDFNLFISKKTYDSWMNLLRGLVYAKERESRKWHHSRFGFGAVPSRSDILFLTSRDSDPPNPVSPCVPPSLKRSAADAFSPTSSSFPPFKRPIGMTLQIMESSYSTAPQSSSPLESLQSFPKVLSSSLPHSSLSAQSSHFHPNMLDTEAMLQDLTKYIKKDEEFPVASGGFGDIWKCTYQTDRGPIKVAVKSLRVYASDQWGEAKEKKNRRIRRELRACARLKHENILLVYGYARGFSMFLAIVSHWAENGNLTTYLERENATLTLVRRFQILRDITAGLEYLHANDAIHGDLTGPNVLIHGDGTACLADFGLSLLYSGVESISQASWTSTFQGNPRWLAPELLVQPDLEADLPVRPSKCSDIYSFSGIMLQVVTSKIPYYYLGVQATVILMCAGKRPPRSRYPGVSDQYWHFIEECWSTAPCDRPSAERVAKVIGDEFNSLSSSSADS